MRELRERGVAPVTILRILRISSVVNNFCYINSKCGPSINECLPWERKSMYAFIFHLLLCLHKNEYHLRSMKTTPLNCDTFFFCILFKSSQISSYTLISQTTSEPSYSTTSTACEYPES